MGYTQTDWATAKITAENFNKMQTQYTEAVAAATGIRANGDDELRCEIVNSFPAHQTGRIIFHTGYSMFFFSTGNSWHLEPKKTFYGDAQRGVFSSTENITFSNSLGATVIRNYRDFTLNSNHTITTERGCRCLVIRSWGDITINGIIDLDKKGGFGDRHISIGGVQYDLLGGMGGNGGFTTNAEGGTAGSNHNRAGGGRGGGGAGGASRAVAGSIFAGAGGGNSPVLGFEVPVNAHPDGRSGYYMHPGGSSGDPFFGAAGGGGGGQWSWSAISDNWFNIESGAGGSGPAGSSSSGGGGGIVARDAPSGNHVADSGKVKMEAGGGALVLLAGGNITINGQLLLRGGGGGDGGDAFLAGSPESATFALGGAGGGGSGGGRLVVIRRGSYQNVGSILLAGGSGGQPGNSVGPAAGGFSTTSGSNGQDGSVSTYQL